MARGKSEAGKLTQKEMVRAAIAELGWDAKPQPMHATIKDKFNVDLATNVISNYKSVLKRENGKGRTAGGGAKRGRKPGAQFEDLEAVRGMVTRLGADQVKKLVDMADMFS